MGEFWCGGVAVWRSCGVEEWQCAGVAVWGKLRCGKCCSVWRLRCGGVAMQGKLQSRRVAMWEELLRGANVEFN